MTRTADASQEETQYPLMPPSALPRSHAGVPAAALATRSEALAASRRRSAAAAENLAQGAGRGPPCADVDVVSREPTRVS